MLGEISQISLTHKTEDLIKSNYDIIESRGIPFLLWFSLFFLTKFIFCNVKLVLNKLQLYNNEALNVNLMIVLVSMSPLLTFYF